MLDRLKYAMRALLARRQVERELDEEIALHVSLATQQNIERGMPPGEARRQALLAFGGRDELREAHRDRRGTRWFEDTLADVRYSARALRRNPGLVIAAVLTLALGMGANTAIFSAVSAVLLRPLPFARPDRLVMVGENDREFLWHMADAAPANYLDWRARVGAFEDAMAYTDYPVSVTLMIGGSPELASTAMVTGNFFSVLGVRPEAGRSFRDDETWSTGAPVVMISDRLWRQRFGGNPAIVGTSLQVNGKPATIIGVAPPGFSLPGPWFDVWAPFGWRKDEVGADWFRRAHWVRVVARLRDGVTIDRAQSELRAVADQLKTEYPATNRIMDAELAPLHTFLVGDVRLPLLALLGAVSLLLLLACANVGNLLLVRASTRQREIAVRSALGAGRWRLARQALTESVTLSLIGGASGVLLGWWGTHALLALQPADGASVLRVYTAGFDWRVAAYAMGVSIASGMLFGVAPAVWASHRDPNEALNAAGRATSGSPRMRRWGERLAVGEVAIALALAVAAGLVVRSYDNLRRVPPGFDSRNVFTAELSISPSRYDSSAKVQAFYDALLARVRALPGVSSAAAVTTLPLTAPGWSSDFSIEGQSAGHFGASLLHRQITPDYFRTMRVPLLRGRVFSDADRGPLNVVVINEAFARAYFAGQDPIGQRIAFDRVPTDKSVWRTIVGVVGDEHQTTPATPPAIEVIAPFAQEMARQMFVVVKTEGEPMAIAPAFRRVVAELDPQLAIEGMRSMDDVRAASMARDRFLMMLLAMFGVVGLALAVVGVYGVIAQLARGRTREMGIRIALGARGSTVQWLIVRRGLLLCAAGVAIGGVAAWYGTRAMGGLLFGIGPNDPLTFMALAAVLIGAGLVASWVPAMRAGNVDPVSVLREE